MFRQVDCICPGLVVVGQDLPGRRCFVNIDSVSLAYFQGPAMARGSLFIQTVCKERVRCQES